MNLIKIENTINIKGNDLQVVEYKGVRVLSSYDIARLHGKEVKAVNQQFERNKGRLEEGVDYFLIDREELLKSQTVTLPPNLREVILNWSSLSQTIYHGKFKTYWWVVTLHCSKHLNRCLRWK